MTEHRITTHPILEIEPQPSIEFTWQGQPLTAQPGETIAAALFAHGIRVFGRHHRDGAPQGIFCANGQCAQCMVIADNRPVKACMTPVTPGLHVEPLNGLPKLPAANSESADQRGSESADQRGRWAAEAIHERDTNTRMANGEPASQRISGAASQRISGSVDNSLLPTPYSLLPSQSKIEVPVLILGGGPAGMSAALELAHCGIRSLLVDDKARLGGKLVLQTHRFFGDINAVYAGTRGIDIAARLENEIRGQDAITVWLNSTALAVFSDGVVGILRGGDAIHEWDANPRITNHESADQRVGESADQRVGESADQRVGESTNHELRVTPHVSRFTFHEEYCLVQPQILLVATGAREKSLVFRGNTLPGVYGAGAFQTLVNRDRVRAAERLFIVGGGNVGLIAGYHALQAGIEVVGLVEALPECGGYKVHKDKLARLGAPIYTSHTVLSANGDGQVESVTIAQVDARFRPIPGTEKTFACDTLLIAVGLDPVNEFTEKAREYGMTVFDAGDAAEIAEASAAIFSGKIRGREIAREFAPDVEAAPDSWYHTVEVLKSRPGAVIDERIPEAVEGVTPVFHCSQEIPCNPCTSICPQQLIHIDPADIRALPEFLGPHVGKTCLGCDRCVGICPGLAITLVDYRQDAAMPTVTLAYEFQTASPQPRSLQAGTQVTALDTAGNVLGEVEVTHVNLIQRNDHTALIKVRAPQVIARRIAGIRPPATTAWETTAAESVTLPVADDEIVCRCERVTAGALRDLIRKGYRDMNEIKAVTRAGMGACGGKTCTSLILRLFREEGVPPEEITANVKRPLFIETPLGVFAAGKRVSESASQREGESAGQREGELQIANCKSQTGKSSESQTAPYSLLPTPYSPSNPKSYDVILIGAGSVGTPAALALARAGVNVLVVDGAASQGQGSNKAAIGGVRATHSDPAKIQLCLRSLEIFSTWEETYGHNIEWKTGGYCFVAYRPEEETTLKNLLEVQQRYGLNIAWRDKDALLEIAPALNPEGLRGGTYSPGDGHCSTLLAGHAFYDAAKQAGAAFRFNEAVREIMTEPQVAGPHRHVTGIRTDQGEYHAPVVINAAGTWAGEVGRWVGLNHPILPEAHEGGITEPVQPFLDPMLVDIRTAPGSKNYYFFQLHSGQVVFCLSPEPIIAGCDRRETSDFLPLVAPRIVDLVPRLSAIRVRRTWRGIYPMTPDGAPIVGWARELEGYLMAIGMCGQGFMLGPGLGELLARMVTQTVTAGDQAILEEISPYRAFAGQEALK